MDIIVAFPLVALKPIVNRRGRKRKSGRRYPSGDLKPLIREQIDFYAKNFMPHRKALPEKDASDPKGESELGRMLLLGRLSQGEYQAGLRFGGIVRRYLATIQPPRLSGRSEVLGIPTASFECPAACVGENCECVRRRQEYGDAHAYVAQFVGHIGLRTLRTVITLDQPCPADLINPFHWALCALKQFFGIKE